MISVRSAAMIETHGLSKTFMVRRGKATEGDNRAVVAVQSVDLLVGTGEIYGFLGPNGAGKTTTMRMLATLLAPSGGRASIAGHDLLREPARIRRHIGYVGQSGGAMNNATGRENLMLQARLYGMSSQEARKRTTELMSALELDAFADRLAKTYSGGQRRRLDLAMGMVHRPALLFLDEPTTGLDPQSRARLWDEVRALRDEGTTIFLTTHYLEEADALCDRLAVMDAGRIAGEDTPDALKRRIAGDLLSLGIDTRGDAQDRVRTALASQPFVRDLRATTEGVQVIVDRGEAALPIVLRLLDAAAVPIHTVKLARPSLDDVFLRLTGRSLRESPESATSSRHTAKPVENLA